MTRKNKVLVYLVLILSCVITKLAYGPAMLFFFADMDGKIRTITD